uniref:CUB domain-containing protein n=1 Tax=Steinernema glaseri TaxID=37863 RepID=A0A1I8AGG1_9BILA
MLLLFLSFVLLWGACDSRYEGKRYTARDPRYQHLGYYYHIKYVTHTADEPYAGTESFIRFSFGYINEETNVLIYLYDVDGKTRPWTYERPYEYQRNRVDNFTGWVKDDPYHEAESACAREMNDRTSYEICLVKPNLVVINPSLGPGRSLDPECEWMLDDVKLNVTLVEFTGVDWPGPDKWQQMERILTGVSFFIPNQQWFEYGYYYFRSSPKRKPRNVFKGFKPKVGQELYPSLNSVTLRKFNGQRSLEVMNEFQSDICQTAFRSGELRRASRLKNAVVATVKPYNETVKPYGYKNVLLSYLSPNII